MKSLLDALQEGRLIELPDNNKNRALEYLAALIEAIPGVEVEGGVTENVLAREQSHNTGIGHGWACPHARARHDGELVCSVGWSPTGIDYGSPDNAPVHGGQARRFAKHADGKNETLSIQAATEE